MNIKAYGALQWMSLGAAFGLIACAPVKTASPQEAKVFAPAAWRAPIGVPAPISGTWWQTFDEPAINDLVEAALAHNTDILEAISRVEEARQQIRLSHSALLPTLDGSVGGQTNRSLGTTGITHTRSIQPELQASYELDLWGRLRTLENAAQMSYQASQSDRDNIRLSVASTTVRAYILLVSLDTQLKVTRDTAQSRRDALRVAEDRANEGYTSQLELTQAQSEYESAAQMIPELEQAIRQQENAIRLLTGTLPGDLHRGRELQTLTPPTVPGLLPAQLLRRRPDIQQAEQLVAAADLKLDARRDEFLPQVQLSSGIGRLYVNALDFDPVKVWDLGASVLAPIYSAGRLEAQVGVATAQRNQAAYSYRATALKAFGEVENSLSGVKRLEEQITRVHARRVTLARSLEIARDRYQGGYSSYLEVLDAQRNLFNTELSAIQIRENQLKNVISLYQALGGGWVPEK
ncbi:efflux transporter outer membrane subunit [Pseudomonas sp. LY-1]|jgi:NodT family efflux transporter outer membrane factor (OMF) lipoprotein|uniref:Efflux transporter outer membrane subunit n=6 Tax=Pseudomonas fluorescens group TaxID=136843 RepID=A0ABS9F1S5_9PSED|nr:MULTISPECIES: efflux transporter outer membrane subunit [Pseudomonas fluorescens group]MBI6555413.1 efflux transporter outer membrane subunit [Pseudomonas veronii]MBI6652625.1 efflux transporter outer membrane subunit [Pseudomonas veronii]MCF4982281.1 efflux transporter outer membrane subunit [Pseudomonas gessardii]MCF5106345.1 efflux transporter outer membrane subunit [Pseudomonas gessardii]